MKAWINGEFVDWDEANVSLLSHSFGRGSAIFEVLDIVNTPQGPAYFGLKEHIDRLFNSADYIFMKLPLTQEEVAAALYRTAMENGVTLGAAKLFAYFSVPEFTAIPQNPQVDVAIFCINFADIGIKQSDLSLPARVGISTFTKIHPSSVPVHAKVVGNYVNAYLAKMEVKQKGYDDVIMLDIEGFIAEGATANLFFVKDGTVVTPGLRNALPGVTRIAVLEALAEIGYPVEEADIRPEEIVDFDEAFYSGSLARIQPIRAIGGTDVGDDCPGPVTEKLAKKMQTVYEGNAETFEKWLTPIK
jgi:branched-chain amino acid aminotransferase